MTALEPKCCRDIPYQLALSRSRASRGMYDILWAEPLSHEDSNTPSKKFPTPTPNLGGDEDQSPLGRS